MQPGLCEDDATAVIRVEWIAISDSPIAGAIEMELDDSIYLGDHWEYRMHCGGFAAKAQGTRQFKAGKVWATIPEEAVWVFPARK